MYNSSVALCTYNGSKYIVAQLRSIAEQTIVPDQIIICDDNSSDNTIALVNEFAKSCSISIQVFVNEGNLGVKNNFQKALSLCTNEIIFLSDQDDLWLPQKVETLMKYFKDNPSKNVVFTDGFILNETTKTNQTIWEGVDFTKRMQSRFENPLALIKYLLSKRNVATGATIAVRSMALKKYLPFPPIKEILHDYFLALQAASSGSLGFISEKLIYYRIHSSQQLGFRSVKVPFYKKIFYYTPYIGIMAILERRTKKNRIELAAYLEKFTSDEEPLIRRYIQEFS